MYRLLLVDDELSILHTRKAFLEKQCNIVDAVQTATDALSLVRQHSYDGILLDVMLVETTGFSLCEDIKRLTDTPIIFLSSLTDSETQIKGFSSGGVDYITKDCSLDLFWIKVRTRLIIDKKRVEETTLSFPPLILNLKNRELTLDGKQINLTNTEFDILSLMCSKPYEVLGISDFYHHIWGYTADDGHGIQVHMSRLRRKLEKAFPTHYFLETVWGKGYQFIPMTNEKNV